MGIHSPREVRYPINEYHPKISYEIPTLGNSLSHSALLKNLAIFF